ncbi:MAG: hypothetical protein H6569_04275 [Lewinellaceae bacterium]|nr:hypothetical protein [Lewinellaceae bacterium]
MLNFKNIIYALSCLSFSIVIGAAVYEHMAVVPKWSAAPPASLSMFQGEYGLDAASFWTMIHPVTLVLLIISLALFWKTKSRQNIAAALVGYAMLLVVTATYFVPELMAIIKSEYLETVDETLKGKADLWETLSLVRLAILVILSVVLNMGLTRVNRPASDANM